MSRYYGMEVSVNGLAPDRVDAVKAAAGQIWPFEHWSDGEGGIVSYAEDRLCGGETEDEFSLRLAEAIWQANTDNGMYTISIQADQVTDTSGHAVDSSPMVCTSGNRA